MTIQTRSVGSGTAVASLERSVLSVGRPLRIVQVIGAFDASGAETMVRELANALARRGHEAAVTCRVPGPLAESLRGVGYHVLPKRRAVDAAYLRRLCTLIRRLDADLVHSHLFGNNLYAYLAARLTRRPIVMTLHGLETLRSWKRVLAYRAMARHTDRVVAVSDAIREAFERRIGPRSGRLTVVPNGIDLSRFAGGEDRDAIRHELGIPNGAAVVGAVGNIKPVKGYDVLLEAFARVLRVRSEAHLVIAGEAGVSGEFAAYKTQLDAQVQGLGLAGRIRFLGSRSDIPRLLSAFDVYVLPSRSEGTSLALLEAMASARAIVATAVGGTPYILRDGETGLLIPSEAPDALEAAILRLLGDLALAARLGSAARTASGRYGVEAMTDAYLDVYAAVRRRR